MPAEVVQGSKGSELWTPLSPARWLARAFTAHRSLAHPKKSARVRLVQRGSRGTDRSSQPVQVSFLGTRYIRPAVGNGRARGVLLAPTKRTNEKLGKEILLTCGLSSGPRRLVGTLGLLTFQMVTSACSDENLRRGPTGDVLGGGSAPER